MLPSGARGIEAYLASGAIKGVGPKTAQRIVAHFGDKTFEILDGDLGRLDEVPGLGPQAAPSPSSKAGAPARGDRELVTFLGEHGISPGLAARLRKVYGHSALAMVRAQPLPPDPGRARDRLLPRR